MLLPILALMAYQARQDAQEKVRDERSNARHLASLLANGAVLRIRLAQQTLQGLTLVPAVTHPDNRAACAQVLVKAVEQNESLTAISLNSPDGKAICSSTSQLPPHASGEVFFQEALRLKSAVTSDFVVGRVTHKSVLVLARPILDEQDAVRSVLLAGLDLVVLARALEELPVTRGTNIVVVDGKGTVLMPERWLGRSVADHPVFRRIAGSGKETAFDERGLDGVERAFAARPLHRTIGGQAYVWVAVPKSSIAWAALREFLQGTLIVFVTVLLLFLAIWRTGTRMVLRPIKLLSEAALKLGKAELAARTNLPHTDDEIGQLAASFDDMATSIEQREAELARSHESLLRANRALRVLSAVNHAIIGATDEQALLDEMCHVAVTLGGYRTAWVGRAEQDAGKSVSIIASAGLPDEYVGQLNITWEDVERGRGPTGTAVREGRAVVIHSIQANSRFAPWREGAAKMGYESVVALPVFVGGRVWGAVTVYSTEAEIFDEEETRLLQELAGDLGFGIESLRLRREKEEADEALHRMNEALEQRVLERTIALEKANEELALSNKELETFSYSASHDLRAPLRVLDGFSEIVEKDYGHLLPPEGRDYLLRIRLAAQRMGQLIDDLLELARVSRVELGVVLMSLSQLASEVMKDLAAQEPDRQVRVTIAPGMTARADPGLMRIVLQNLLGNAWKYTGKRADAEIEFGVSLTPSGEQAFFVRDNGAGFDMARAQRLFEPFVRLHGAADFPGSGIGLTTVARILSRHGGRIWAEAEKGRGATFYFVL